MTNNANPWNDLTIPTTPGTYSTRRVSIDTNHNFFWAKNDRGQCCLIFSCSLNSKVKVDEIRLKGIDLEQHISQDQNLDVIITLIDDPSRDIFRTISHDLIAATAILAAKKSEIVVRAISLRLKRWQDLLGRKQTDLLSKPEQLGLFGELYFLKDYFFKRLDKPSAITTWQGPNGSEQDFGWSEFLFEIKTQLSTSDRKVSINSLEQLDDVSGKIWLIHQTIAVDESDAEESYSLRTLVDQVKAFVSSDIYASDMLSAILTEIGYEDHPSYAEVKYIMSQRMFFRVDEHFPALKRSTVSSKIISATYLIDIAAFSAMCIEEMEFLRDVFPNE